MTTPNRKAQPMTTSTTVAAMQNRLIEAIAYDQATRQVRVRFSDSVIAAVSLRALKVPDDAQVERVTIDEFSRGFEIYLADGTMIDTSADFVTWLTNEDYAAAYPEDTELGPRIGANVRRLRTERGMSQMSLAELAEMQGPNLNRLENGKHVPTLDVLLRVAKALGVALSALLGSSPPQHPVTPPPAH